MLWLADFKGLQDPCRAIVLDWLTFCNVTALSRTHEDTLKTGSLTPTLSISLTDLGTGGDSPAFARTLDHTGPARDRRTGSRAP